MSSTLGFLRRPKAAYDAPIRAARRALRSAGQLFIFLVSASLLLGCEGQRSAAGTNFYQTNFDSVWSATVGTNWRVGASAAPLRLAAADLNGTFLLLNDNYTYVGGYTELLYGVPVRLAFLSRKCLSRPRLQMPRDSESIA